MEEAFTKRYTSYVDRIETVIREYNLPLCVKIQHPPIPDLSCLVNVYPIAETTAYANAYFISILLRREDPPFVMHLHLPTHEELFPLDTTLTIFNYLMRLSILITLPIPITREVYMPNGYHEDDDNGYLKKKQHYYKVINTCRMANFNRTIRMITRYIRLWKEKTQTSLYLRKHCWDIWLHRALSPPTGCLYKYYKRQFEEHIHL